jgi:hypothetical protein
MSLVSSTTLALRLGVSDGPKVAGAVAAGEAAVLQFIGTDTLALTVRSDRMRFPRERESLPLNFGPLTTLTSITLDGEAVSNADVIAKPWWLEREDPATLFKCGSTYRLAYSTGWANEAALPEAIREAVLLTGMQSYTIDASGGGLVKTSETIGDHSVGYSQLQTATMSTASNLPLTA